MGITIVNDVSGMIIVNTTEVAMTVSHNDSDLVVFGELAEPVVIEVLAGEKGDPGLDNVYVGTTPPPFPFEGQIWIDVS